MTVSVQPVKGQVAVREDGEKFLVSGPVPSESGVWGRRILSDGSLRNNDTFVAYVEIASVEAYDEHDDPCPDCGTQLKLASGGGVRCPKHGCGYWFCY
jgi:hypothetical protein